MTATTEATVQDLLDRNEITDLVHRLGVCLDEGGFDDMRSLFVEDATVQTPGGIAEGRDAAIAQAARNHRPEHPCQHVITNVLIDVDGDRAHARANLVVSFGPGPGAVNPAKPRELPVEFTGGQVYRFELARTPGGWRLSGIQTTPVWTSGTPIPLPPGE